MSSAVKRPLRRSFNWRSPRRSVAHAEAIRATDSYPSPLQRLRVRACRSASVVLASSSVVQLVQKLPRAVKNGFDGSNRPQITLPHMHSMTGLPALSRMSCPASSRAQSWFSNRTNSCGNPRAS